MNDAVILLAPFIVALLVVGFGFIGCTSFDEAAPSPAPPVIPPPLVPPKPVPYKDVVAKTAGFVAHWPLDEPSGNVAFVNGPLKPAANGKYELPGVTLADDKTGLPGLAGNMAPFFNGSSGYVEVPYQPPLNPAANLSFSIELWMKPKVGVGPQTQVLISSRQFGMNQQRGYDISLLQGAGQPNNLSLRARVFAPGTTGSEVVVLLSQGNPDAWRHVVCTYAGLPSKKLTVYVSVIGLTNPLIEEKSNVNFEGVAAPGAPLRFAAGSMQGGGAQNFFAGWLDEVAFYNVALSPTDVQAHFKAATTPQ